MTLRFAAIVGATALLAACASPDTVDTTSTALPVYAKDGVTIVGYSDGRDASGNCANGLTREEDLEDGDIDCSS